MTTTEEFDPYPRKKFEESVRYAVQVSQVYLSQLESHDVALDGLRYLELGPGADFAPQLVLASHGARVTLADPYLARWDPAYHPQFYAAFLSAWPGAKEKIAAAVAQGGYEGILALVNQPSEDLRSLGDSSFDFVTSNAVLEHVLDVNKAIRELARVTRTGGLHTHQIDFRDHHDFDQPLEYLAKNPSSYQRFRKSSQGRDGTSQRLPEMLEAFTRYFWIWELSVSDRVTPDYVARIAERLPANSPYRQWPSQLLRDVGGRIWIARKDTPLDPVLEAGALARLKSWFG